MVRRRMLGRLAVGLGALALLLDVKMLHLKPICRRTLRYGRSNEPEQHYLRQADIVAVVAASPCFSCGGGWPTCCALAQLVFGQRGVDRRGRRNVEAWRRG